MKNVKKLFLNTILLTAVSFAMQTVSVAFNVWLTNRIGSVGIGLFQLIMTVYGLSVTLGCGGVRLASTRLTVESDARGENAGKTLFQCIRYGLVTGSAIGAAVLIGADLIASLWLSNSAAAAPLRILAFALPFIAMSSALNGYFTALRKIVRYSAVRIFEQGVKIVTVAVLLGKLLPMGTEYGCIAIVIGMSVSEIFSFLSLYILYIIDRGKYKHKFAPSGTLKNILHIAVPDVTGSGARSVLLMIEHLLIPVGFRKSGSSYNEALSVYGNIHGMVFPLILYPSAILTSLSGLLVPEIAECRTKGMEKQINYIIMRVMKITLIFGIGTAGVMYAFADGLSNIIYDNSQSTAFIQILAPLIPVMYCDMTVDGILKGLDQQVYSMRYNILDSALCVALVYILLPRYSVKGYIFVLFASEIINFFLSMRRLTVVSTVKISPLYDIFIPCACIVCAVSGVSVLADMTGISAYYGKASLTLCILAAAAVYFVMLYTFSCISGDDIMWFLSITGIRVGERRKKDRAKRQRFFSGAAG